MWGQGLREEQKFERKAVREIGQLLGRESTIAANYAHSGAPIRVPRDPECDPECKHIKYVDTYPTLFDAKLSTTGRNEFEKDFIENNIQDRSRQFGEIPSPFPTISYQVQQVDQTIANSAELLILNGGANDIDFELFLNPQHKRTNFLEYFDPLLKDSLYGRVKSLIRQARDKFPRAVILYTGYFSPFAPGHSNREMKSLFQFLSGEPFYKMIINNYVNLKDVDELVVEAQHRSQIGLSRSLYWIRKAIAESAADANLGGPGILFIHPQFGADNTVFESNSFFHSEYIVPRVKDPVKQAREQNNFRAGQDNKIKSLARLLKGLRFKGELNEDVTIETVSTNSEIIVKAKELLSELNGPGRLRKALQEMVEHERTVDNEKKVIIYKKDYDDVRKFLVEEIDRIRHVRIASFLHPNEKGAQRYANILVKRFRERHHHVNLNVDIVKFRNREGSFQDEKAKNILSQYNLASYNLGPALVSQIMLVDSIALEVTSASDSAGTMYDPLFLNLGNGNRWQLNFGLKYVSFGALKPGTTDLFTIDGLGLHLSSITKFTIERRKTSLSSLDALRSADPWKPSKISLFLNGIEVFSVPFFSNLSRNDELRFPYPKI